MKWFLYVLQCSDGTYYTGATTDIKRRLNEHNTSSRGAKYTKARRPVKLVYSSEYASRSSVQKAEYKFKQLTRKQKQGVITMKGNKKIFSKLREERVQGYIKLFKAQDKQYAPSKDIAEDLVEAMEALGYEVDLDQALAYLKSSYAAHDRRYYLQNNRN